MKKKIFLILACFIAIFLFSQVENKNLIIVTKTKDWIQDTRFVIPIYTFFTPQKQEYVRITDFIDFIKSAYLNGSIYYNDDLDFFKIDTKIWTLKIFLDEDLFIYNNQKFFLSHPLYLYNGKFFLSVKLLQKISTLTEDFETDYTGEKYEKASEKFIRIPKSKTAVKYTFSKQTKKKFPEEIFGQPNKNFKEDKIAIILKINYSSNSKVKIKLENQINLLQKYIPYYAGKLCQIVFITDDFNSPLELAKNLNEKKYNLLIYIIFTKQGNKSLKSCRCFYLRKDIHPYYSEEGNIILPYEYSTNFSKYVSLSQMFVNIVTTNLKNLTTLQVIEPTCSLIALSEYLSMPSIIIEFYNLNDKNDIAYFLKEKNIRDIGRALGKSIKEFENKK